MENGKMDASISNLATREKPMRLAGECGDVKLSTVVVLAFHRASIFGRFGGEETLQ